jgi:uncharacterized protein YodC (DUF2158 family)
MGAFPEARSYRQQHDSLRQSYDRCPLCNSRVGPITAANLRQELSKMTTDPDEGRRQIEAMMRQPVIAVGTLVRLRAGGERVMTVVAIEDYGNWTVCEWQTTQSGLDVAQRESFPAGALVRIEDGGQQMGQAGAAEGSAQVGRAPEGHAEQGDAVEAPSGGEGV